MENRKILNELFVELFNHILYLEEQNLQLKGINLTMNEIHTFEAIRDLGEPVMGKVARKLMITLGTLTTSVKRLEAKGYIIRSRDEVDARNVRIKLTQQGEDVIKIHDDFHTDMIDTVINDLDESEEEVLLHALTKIKHYFMESYID